MHKVILMQVKANDQYKRYLHSNRKFPQTITDDK